MGSPYDYQSIMHYGRNDFAINSNIDTITPLFPTPSLGGNVMSFLDILDINIYYGCTGSYSTLCGSSNEQCTSGVCCTTSLCTFSNSLTVILFIF